MARRKIPRDAVATRELGHRIQRLRRQLGWTQVEFAAQVDVEPATMSRYETGKRPIASALLTKIAALLGVPLSELLDEPREPAAREEHQLLAAWRAFDSETRSAVLTIVRRLAPRRGRRR